MKNIHLLLAGESYLSLNCSYRDSAIGTQVGKPYWTYSKDWKHHLSVTDASVRPHNIYITSDEKIKEGNWFLPQGHINPHKLKGYNKINGDLESYNGLCYDISKCKKIILTTDQDLIKDGVQAIDDEFLEWFVKNPSCEWVDIETMMECEKCGKEHCDNLQCRGYKDIPYYKIIIPKEEPKFENSIDNTMNIMSIANSMFGKKEEPKLTSTINKDELGIPEGYLTALIGVNKQKTLEEELLQQIKFCLICKNDSQAIRLIEKYGFEKQEGRYSQEDLKEAFKVNYTPFSATNIGDFDKDFNRWFEKFKNK